MSEISMYEAYKKKLQGLCDEHNLVYKFNRSEYPITLTIRPCGGMDAQLSMLEAAEDEGYISPDAFLMFIHKDGAITYKTSERFTISDALFSKLKNLFKNLHYCWLQYFFRATIENGTIKPGNMPEIDEDDANDSDLPAEAEPLEEYDDEELPDIICDDAIDENTFKEAVSIVRAENKASVPLLQRRLNVGYAEAARIMNRLEDAGVVGPFNGGEPREVLPVDEPDDFEEGADNE